MSLNGQVQPSGPARLTVIAGHRHPSGSPQPRGQSFLPRCGVSVRQRIEAYCLIITAHILPRRDLFKELVDKVATGALYNAPELFKPAKCHAGTLEAILRGLEARADG